MANRVSKTVRVAGHVQGVWFRAWTKEQADALGVAGWVRNSSDGSVEAHVVGEEAAVAELIERMRRGPSAAEVADIRIEEGLPDDSPIFEIRRA